VQNGERHRMECCQRTAYQEQDEGPVIAKANHCACPRAVVIEAGNHHIQDSAVMCTRWPVQMVRVIISYRDLPFPNPHIFLPAHLFSIWKRMMYKKVGLGHSQPTTPNLNKEQHAPGNIKSPAAIN
jgi:hypothetical protein